MTSIIFPSKPEIVAIVQQRQLIKMKKDKNKDEEMYSLLYESWLETLQFIPPKSQYEKWKFLLLLQDIE